MKLIIDIPEEEYRKVQNGRASVSMMRNAIRIGIPIDKIRAEIEESRYGLINDGLDVALKIIDKYKAERGG